LKKLINFTEMPGEVLDCYETIVIGAEMTGVCAAYFMRKFRPFKTIAVLERRPQFESAGNENLTPESVAIKHGITQNIRLGHEVMSCDFDCVSGLWTVKTQIESFTARWLICTNRLHSSQFAPTFSVDGSPSKFGDLFRGFMIERLPNLSIITKWESTLVACQKTTRVLKAMAAEGFDVVFPNDHRQPSLRLSEFIAKVQEANHLRFFKGIPASPSKQPSPLKRKGVDTVPALMRQGAHFDLFSLTRAPSE